MKDVNAGSSSETAALSVWGTGRRDRSQIPPSLVTWLSETCQELSQFNGTLWFYKSSLQPCHFCGVVFYTVKSLSPLVSCLECVRPSSEKRNEGRRMQYENATHCIMVTVSASIISSHISRQNIISSKLTACLGGVSAAPFGHFNCLQLSATWINRVLNKGHAVSYL